MRHMLGILALFVAAMTSAGCLRKETRHRLYLSSPAELRWVIDESGVASDDPDPGQRLEEERGYITAALIGAQPLARGLETLAPDGLVRTTIVRDERPFHVITEARFSRVDAALERLFRTCGLHASVALEDAGDATRLRARLDFTRGIDERPTPAMALLEDLESFRFVLTQGHFVDSDAFDVIDRSSAQLSKEGRRRLEAAMETRAVVDLVLVWQGGN